MQIKDRKCRECGEAPKKNRLEATIEQLKLAKKAKRSNVNLMTLKGKIIQGIDAISIIDKPRCNICNDVMHHNRTIKTPKGTPLKWQCYKCNEIIKAEDL